MIFHSSFEYSYLWLPLIGILTGLFTSMIGGGGGFLFIPVLILIYSVPAQTAVPTSLAASLPICIAGSVGHYREGNIDLRVGSLFALAGITGAFSGAGITSLVTNEQLKISFGIYSVLIASHMIINTWRMKKGATNSSDTDKRLNLKKIAKSSLYGFISGIITGTFGTSGAAPVLAGLFTMKMPIKLVVGTSLMVVFVNAVSALGAHFLVGKIDLTLVYLLTAGTIIGAVAGPKLLAGIKIGRQEGTIRHLYALGMIILGIIIILS